MKKPTKIIGIVCALALLAAGCGRGGLDSSPAATGTSPLDVGGAGVTIDQVQGSAAPAVTAVAMDVNNNNQVAGYVEATAGATFTAAIWTVTATGTTTPTALAPIAGNTFCAAFALDDAGKAVGQSAKGSRKVAVIWPAGTTVPTELPALDAAGNTIAFDISADGTCIVGEAQNAAKDTRAVIWIAASGAFTAPPIVLPVSLAGSTFSSASGVARDGARIWVAGNAEDDVGFAHARLWSSTDGGTVFTATDLSTVTEAGSSALAVNTSGRVVGELEATPGVFSAALWRANNAGAYSRYILAADGVATKISESGKAVGTAAGRATLWDTTALFFTSTTLSDTASQAYGINDRDDSGQMVIGVDKSKGFMKKAS